MVSVEASIKRAPLLFINAPVTVAAVMLLLAVGAPAAAQQGGAVPGGPVNSADQIHPGTLATPLESRSDLDQNAVGPVGGTTEPTTLPDQANGSGDRSLPAQSVSDPSALPAAETKPTPNFLNDPAGAIAQLISPPERRTDLPHDLSPWGMFLAADWVVKGVMLGLAFASLATWTIWLAKSIEIACARARAKRALAAISDASNLDAAARALVGRGGPAAFMVRSAVEELRRSGPALDHAGSDGVKERVGARLSRLEAQAGRRLTKGTGVLATIGSTSPFVGLFGTVWGIMNSFIGISEAQTTNLAVVAPGIAEALLATAIGLVAAIPAVVIYNVFARSITGYRQLLADAASGVEQLVGLDLDFRKVPANDDHADARAVVAAE